MKILNWKKLAQLIEFEPTQKQRYIIEHLKRFNITVGGKRVGKTKLAAFLALLEVLKMDKTIWVVAPQYALGERIWDYLFQWSTRYLEGILKPNVQHNYIENKVAGSIIRLKSADNELSLKGEGLDLVIGDEVGDWKKGIWHNYVRPNITETRPSGERGRAFLIGNANYFGSEWHQLFLQGKQRFDTFTYHLPTAVERMDGTIISNNPEIVTSEELERLKKDTPAIEWRQNYLAHFVEGQGTVFTNILDCATGDFRPRSSEHFYYIGVDLGRLQDFSVITVIDSQTWEVVYWSRFQEIEYPFQKRRIMSVVDLYGRYNTKLIIDQTGLGQPIVDDLQREGINIEGVTLTNQIKKNLIEKLSILLEQKKLRYPKIQQLIDELQVFGYTMTQSGRIKYSAPSGFHDDCVISLALAIKDLEGEPNQFTKSKSPDKVFQEGKTERVRTIFSREQRKAPVIKPYV